MKQEVFITVFTPTFNRAHTLPRTYESLKKQSLKAFEWLIVDDGSADNTGELVRQWIDSEKDFLIRYIYKPNGGMHTAYNTAYEHIHTELNICIDSDDCLADEAIRKIYDFWQCVKDRGYAGIIALDADFAGNVIGKSFDPDLTETTFLDYYRKGGRGDKKFVYRTDVVKQYPPYPEFAGEHYVGISCRYALIDQDYKLAVLNECLCNVEYQPDGHSRSMYAEYVRNPKGFAYYRKIFMQYPISRKKLITYTIHYVSSSILAKNPHFVSESPRKLLTLMLAPLGAVLSLYVRRKAKQQIKS